MRSYAAILIGKGHIGINSLVSYIQTQDKAKKNRDTIYNIPYSENLWYMKQGVTWFNVNRGSGVQYDQLTGVTVVLLKKDENGIITLYTVKANLDLIAPITGATPFYVINAQTIGFEPKNGLSKKRMEMYENNKMTLIRDKSRATKPSYIDWRIQRNAEIERDRNRVEEALEALHTTSLGRGITPEELEMRRIDREERLRRKGQWEYLP
jgi:hypothetical protein